MDFKLITNNSPAGDQPQAIAQLVKNLKSGARHQVLRGVTGSGKTYTAASVIEQINKPTLVISHNKTLAWQLYQEFKEFFPQNAVHYFVSYYDYYQPEAYIPASDTYIEKDASINKKIDAMRHAAVQSVLTRPDTLIVASVSCIYNLGSPETYQRVTFTLRAGQRMQRRELMTTLVRLGFARNDTDPHAGLFRAKGGMVEIYPANGEEIVRVTIDENTISAIEVAGGVRGTQFNTFNGFNKFKGVQEFNLFPASFWITPEDKLKIAMQNISTELQERLSVLKKEGRDIEAYRLEKKTNYDLEMMQGVGYCSGIENYSSHLEFRKEGSPPFTLLNYLSENFLTIIDESHMTIPQVRGMYAGDQARKTTLIEHGFRLPSAIDNRPLTFEEFNTRMKQVVYMSATPNEYEIAKATSYKLQTTNSPIVEQIVRPTGLLDPPVEVRGTKEQMRNAIEEIKKEKERGNRTLVVTITKRLAEDIAEYLAEEGLNVSYIHSEINTLERPVIMNKLRRGEFDVLVGVNLLREGLDLPEVSLVIIFDADKEGFLRNETTLLQTIGRAARHIDGRAILYGDTVTASMKAALRETKRRRAIQTQYNKENNITPRSIKKNIYALPDEMLAEESKEGPEYQRMSEAELKHEMKRAARELDFEKAAKLKGELERLME